MHSSHKRTKEEETLWGRGSLKKKPLNPTHIFFKREKQPKIMTIRRAIMMSQSNDDEKETL